MDMTWEQKLEAIIALGDDVSLRMRCPGNWHVDHRGVEIGDGHVLIGGCGNGDTPEAAVLNHWDHLTQLKAGQYLVKNAMSSDRRHYRWNGYRWADLPVPKFEEGS
jgi:hypothetical protein